MPLLEKDATFISLQYTEDAARKCEQFEKDTGIKIHHWPKTVEAGPNESRYPGYDYSHTLALIQALDLCILPNTTAVHACGAIGHNCWTMTPQKCAWRYQLQGDEMPMYGHWVRQYRQADAVGWEKTVETISKDFDKHFRQTRD